MDSVIGESEVQQYANPVLESAYFISKVLFVTGFIKNKFRNNEYLTRCPIFRIQRMSSFLKTVSKKRQIR